MSVLSPLASSFTSIIVSEIGDKTFFITAILGMTYSMGLVFIGSYTAMALMTVLSCFFGFLLPQIINKFYTDILTSSLFFFFGYKLLHGFFSENNADQGEDEEQEATLEVNNFKKKNHSSKPLTQLNIIRAAIILTFVAEWGDRSQITTIALATENTYTVLSGALLGHLICTGTAVLGGKVISQRISERWINLCGGALFCIFGINNLFALL